MSTLALRLRRTAVIAAAGLVATACGSSSVGGGDVSAPMSGSVAPKSNDSNSVETAGTALRIGPIVGMNQVDLLVRFAREADVDCFLVAGRYTLGYITLNNPRALNALTLAMFRDIEAKRKATRYMHMKPVLVEDVRVSPLYDDVREVWEREGLDVEDGAIGDESGVDAGGSVGPVSHALPPRRV